MDRRSPKRVPRDDNQVLGRAAFAAISAVEGLSLSASGRERISRPTPIEQRRGDVRKAYGDFKGRK